MRLLLWMVANVSCRSEEPDGSFPINMTLQSILITSFCRIRIRRTGMRSKKKLIQDFIKRLQGGEAAEWNEHINGQMANDLKAIIAEENLNADDTINFVKGLLEKHTFTFSWSDIQKIVKGSFFERKEETEERRKRVVEKIKNFFDTYWDLEVKFNG